jgi:hypothetical protein
MTEGGTPQQWSFLSGGRRWALLGLLLVVVALVVWMAVRGGNDTGLKPTAGRSATPSSTPSGSPSVNPNQPAPSATQPTPALPPKKPKKPVQTALGQPADLRNGVTVTVTKVESVKGVGHGPGERSGPAVRLTVSVRNDTRKALNLDLALLNVYFGADLSPASPVSGPGARVLPAELAAGDATTGRYVFSVPRDEQDHLRVDFTYTTEAPKAIFTGGVHG